jgi:tRNA dimethylallyltransferase
VIVGLTQERNELYRRIDGRVDEMIERGLVEEVAQLLKKGYSPSLPSMSGIGYRQLGQFLAGKVTLPEAIDKIKYETHRLARHQYAWFRLSDDRIRWFDISKTEKEAGTVTLNEVKGLIEGLIS